VLAPLPLTLYLPSACPLLALCLPSACPLFALIRTLFITICLPSACSLLPSVCCDLLCPRLRPLLHALLCLLFALCLHFPPSACLPYPGLPLLTSVHRSSAPRSTPRQKESVRTTAPRRLIFFYGVRQLRYGRGVHVGVCACGLCMSYVYVACIKPSLALS
jgi:hypothetical protein